MTAAPRVLVLGGNGFLGSEATRALIERGCEVTTLSRSGSAPSGVRGIAADRRDPVALAAALEGARFDATVDFSAYDSADIEHLLLVPYAALGRYTLISSGQVYLVTDAPSPRAGAPPYREEDSERPLIPEPEPDTRDHAQWSYGVGKRRAESAALALRDSHGVRAVILRLPVVHGAGDPRRRLWTYLERMRDGGPVILPGGGTQLTRYLAASDVGRIVTKLLDLGKTREAIYNLAQPDMVTLREFLTRAARAAGIAGPQFVDATPADLADAGLDDTVSPLSHRWSSVLDPSRAAAEWGFAGTRLDDWLPEVVRALLERPPAPIEADRAPRAREIALATRLSTAGRA